MARDRQEGAIHREVSVNLNSRKIARRAGVTEKSVAVVDAEVRNGELVVTVAGNRNTEETTHRLPDELVDGDRRCLDCGECYDGTARVCPNCGGQNTEYDIHG